MRMEVCAPTEIEEFNFFEENLRRDVLRTRQSAAALVVIEHRFEGRAMPFEEILIVHVIEEMRPALFVAQQGVRIALQSGSTRFKT